MEIQSSIVFSRVTHSYILRPTETIMLFHKYPNMQNACNRVRRIHIMYIAVFVAEDYGGHFWHQQRLLDPHSESR